MKGGELRHKIELQRYSETQDNFGEPIKGYIHFAFAYAQVRPLTGRESYQEEMVSTQQTHKIKMRYIQGVESTMRIVFGGRIFEIIGNPINYHERNIHLTFNAKELFEHDVVHPVT